MLVGPSVKVKSKGLLKCSHRLSTKPFTISNSGWTPCSVLESAFLADG